MKGSLPLRAGRNKAGHPSNIKPLTLDTVHASLLIFPELVKLACALKFVDAKEHITICTAASPVLAKNINTPLVKKQQGRAHQRHPQ